MNVAQGMNFGKHQNCDLFFRGNVKNGNGKRQFFLTAWFHVSHKHTERNVGVLEMRSFFSSTSSGSSKRFVHFPLAGISILESTVLRFDIFVISIFISIYIQASLRKTRYIVIRLVL